MGYYLSATPQGFVLKVLLDIDWSKHLGPRTLLVARGAGLFLDYQLATGLARASGIKFPFANPRASGGSVYSWSRALRSPYVIPMLVGIGMAKHGATPDKLLGVGPTGRASIVQGAMDRYYSKLK